MISAKITGLEELQAKFGALEKQVRFAAARALTATAKAAEKRIQDDMAKAFTSPSPMVKRATFIIPATKNKLEAYAGLKTQRMGAGVSAAMLLKEHFTGGQRGRKPFEKAIHQLAKLPSGYRAITGSGIRKDAYGNPSRADIKEMIGSLRSGMQVWKGRGKLKTKALIGYFVVPIGTKSHLHPGIYKRVNTGALHCFFVFANQAAYRKAISLERIAREVVQVEFDQQFSNALAEAMRTAR